MSYASISTGYSNGEIKYPIGKSIFAVNLPLKLFPSTSTIADISGRKVFHTLFDKHLDHMLMKFQQNHMVRTQLFETIIY